MYGQGIYFADNAEYSHRYAYQSAENGVQTYQMLVCFVLSGDSCQ